jgi:hypothetical protein
MQNWGRAARTILRTEMTRREMSYDDLVEKLAAIGTVETAANLRNKVSRASFSAGFFLECMKAMGVKSILLD